ncbi:DUF1513 domain-containing protein [Balneatrix alpica]|uniref:DUF1513 domain-containing protein n=1 Tax=Balneatrix alpica TaxID=75684 RepID=UPI0027397E3B|nr:DUF1513 domain-containing protein [Balneatrix alpica]
MKVDSQRRQLLAGIVSATTLLALPLQLQANNSPVVLVSAMVDEAGNSWLAGLDEMGDAGFKLPLPGRAHGCCLHPDGRHLVVFARRPGTFAILVDLQRGQALQQLHTGPQQHFYGHGCWSQDGQTLFTSENHYGSQINEHGVKQLSGRGQIGVWRWQQQRLLRQASWDSGGLGPHEIALHPSGCLVVANGGIETHPEEGRTPLNLASMAANLSYLAADSGYLQQRLLLPEELHLLSLRHLAINQHGQVACVMQYQGENNSEVPLLALHQPGQPTLQLLSLPEAANRHQNYLGSVCWDSSGQWLACSAPRGHRIYFYHLPQQQWQQPISLTDGCGLAADSIEASFLLSSGAGGIHSYSPEEQSWQPLPGSLSRQGHWDNHMLSLF